MDSLCASVDSQCGDIFCALKFRLCPVIVQTASLGGFMNKEALIFKIFTESEWLQFQIDGVFHGSAVDKADGFIHLSSGTQVQGTLDKWFTSREALILAAIDSAMLKDSLKWEVSRGGATFPHYYASLTLDQIEAHYRLSPDAQGRYDVSHIVSES